MNTQLVHSIIQVISALPNDEQQLIIATLNRHFHTSSISSEPTSNAGSTGSTLSDDPWDIWHSLGDDAIDGSLDNTSTKGDRYLYTDH